LDLIADRFDAAGQFQWFSTQNESELEQPQKNCKFTPPLDITSALDK
jgi:hypothetical protein